MAIGEAWWFLDHGQAVSFTKLIEVFDLCRITFRHPKNGMVWQLTEDGRSPHSLSSFEELWLSTEDQLTFQTWIDADTDVVIARDDGGLHFTFFFDGLTIDQAAMVTSALVLGAGSVESTEGLVVDRYLGDTGERWRQFFALASTPEPYEADLLLRRSDQGAFLLKVGRHSWLRR